MQARVNPQLVLFDVGSTLIDPHPSARELVVEVLRAHDCAVEVDELAVAEPQAWRAVSHLLPFQRYGQEESRAFWDAFYSALLALLGLPDRSVVRAALYAAFQRVENWRLYPDTIPVLDELRARGYRLGVVSNWEEWLEDLLLALGVHDRFELIVASGQFGRAKPNPSIFQHALGLAGVSAHQAIHIGDSPRDDVAGASAAGLRPILIDRRGRHPNVETERILDLTELLTLLG